MLRRAEVAALCLAGAHVVAATTLPPPPPPRAASVVFMSELVDSNKKLLAVYPVCLFYTLIAWMAYMQ